jgi:hypothetical protein
VLLLCREWRQASGPGRQVRPDFERARATVKHYDAYGHRVCAAQQRLQSPSKSAADDEWAEAIRR